MNGTNKFKGFFLLIELLALFASIGLSIFLNFSITPKIRFESENVDKISYYDENGFDLIVSGSSLEQVEEFKTKDFITNVISVSKFSLNVKTDLSEDYRDILIFESTEDLKYSEFTEIRLIDSKQTTNYVYVDYKFCLINNVGIGDTIKITFNGETKDFIISRVYRTDYMYTDGIIITTKNMIPLNSKSLLVYITTNNKSKLVSYLQNYKPLGTLLNKTAYQTDEEYQNYLDEFNSKNYYTAYVTDLSEERDNTKNDYSQKVKSTSKSFNVSVFLISGIAFLVSLSSFFINAKHKKDKIYKYIQENGNKKILRLYSIYNLSFAIFLLVGSIIAITISISKLTTYYSLLNALQSSYLALIMPTISIIIAYFVTFIKIKKA